MPESANPDSGTAGREASVKIITTSSTAGLSVVLLLLVTSGCSTPPLDEARISFRAGNAAHAAEILETAETPEKDAVLFHMERGTIRQQAGDYENSTRDLVEAAAWYEEFETYSISKGASSWIINDNVQEFRGAPYERNLIHAACALNHFALGLWNNAGVEARRLIHSMQGQSDEGYPDDAYSRYIAGFALEVSDDLPNAYQQYARASNLVSSVTIDPATGRFLPWSPGPEDTAELVCFAGIGQAPGWSSSYESHLSIYGSTFSGYAEIYDGDRLLGRTHLFTDVGHLRTQTEEKEAVKRALKTGARIAFKEALAIGVESATGQEAYGDLVRLILIGLLERPDTRYWHTLPRYLHVARVPCPPHLESIRVVFKNSAGYQVRTKTITQPIQRYGNRLVTFCRDIPEPVLPIFNPLQEASGKASPDSP